MAGLRYLDREGLSQELPQQPELPTENLQGTLGTEVAQIAMTREQARGLLDNFTTEAVRGNITPRAFADGLFEAQFYGVSPDQGRRAIRNSLASPLTSMLVQNSGLAKQLAGQNVGALQAFGVNPETARKYIGLGGDLLEQAKKDGLLKDSVTNEEVAEHLQRPLYGAIQDYIRDNKGNPQINGLLEKAYPKGASPGKSILEGLLYEFE